MMGQVTTRTRTLVQARDRTCAAAGVIPHECGGHLDAGHIVGRGMGGTPRGDRFDGPAWIVLHCRNVNHAIESDAEARRVAVLYGHHRSRDEARASTGGALVRYADGWFHLTDDGQRVPLAWGGGDRAIQAD